MVCIKTAFIWVILRARAPGEVIMAKAGKRTALLHHMGGGNLGDDGTFDAVLQNIRIRWPDSEIVGLSMNPDDTHKRHGIVSYPIRQRTWNVGNTSVNHGTNIKQRADRVRVFIFVGKNIGLANSKRPSQCNLTRQFVTVSASRVYIRNHSKCSSTGVDRKGSQIFSAQSSGTSHCNSRRNYEAITDWSR